MTDSTRQYDPRQQAAIDAADGYFLVLAPPGCGKTDILARRIVEAHRRGVPFDQMLCLTFTNRASRGMRSRIAEQVGAQAAEVFCGNLHRFCSKYIFSERVVPENSSILDDTEQADLFVQCAPDYYTGGKGVRSQAVQGSVRLATYITQRRLGQPDGVMQPDEDFPELYEVAAAHGFDPGRIPSHSHSQSHSHSHSQSHSQSHRYPALRHALTYLRYKADHSLLDFDDLLVLAYDHMRRCPHRTYSWIQVDEVQDLNPLQVAIIDELTGPSPTVMYLGDEQQAIFSFMGAKLGVLGRVKERCRGHVLGLGHNYRAPRYLLDVCNRYAVEELDVDPELLPEAVRDIPRGKHDLILTAARPGQSENSRVLGMVRHYLGLDDVERLAILVSTNYQADSISATLAAAGVEHFKISGTDMFKTKDYKTLAAFYGTLVSEHNLVAWSRLLYGVGACHSLSDARESLSRMAAMGLTPSDMFAGDSALQRFWAAWTSECVVLDTETTGLDTEADEVVQIAACRVRRGRKVPGSELCVLMDTSRPIPPEVGGGPNPLLEVYAAGPRCSRAEGMRRFLDYVGDLPIVGHNVAYDYTMLQRACERDLGEQYLCETHDTLQLAKCVCPGLHRYDLASLVQALSLQGRNSHLADEDVEATVSLCMHIIDRATDLLPLQSDWLHTPSAHRLARKMEALAPLYHDIRATMRLPVSVTHRTLSDELDYMHRRLVGLGYIQPLGQKFDTFLRYVQSEWGDISPDTSLYDMIRSHVYDISSTLNEGDLVNTDGLMDDRVFVMTVYKGKGLEFDNVVVLGASEGNYPFWGVREQLRQASTPAERRAAEAALREEARKFYVAISRARRRLCVSYSGKLTRFMDSIIDIFSF